jgi:hypothetical protein
LADFTLKLNPLIPNRFCWNPVAVFHISTARAVLPLNFLSGPKPAAGDTARQQVPEQLQQSLEFHVRH